ncbi:MAG: hypothetical protein KGK14_10825 [Bacteroidota bacterium]|nr:hypothetical protein [Bacteroidota bacterium]
MKLTFADSPGINEHDLKKLLLVCDELAFFNWPSINLAGTYGSVGQKSPLNHFRQEFEGSPIKLIVDEPPNTTFNSGFYHRYFEKDLESIEFKNTILKGIEKGLIYDHRFDDKQNINTGEFKDFKAWILNNKGEILNTNLYDLEAPKGGFEITNKHQALFAFRLMASSKSMAVSSTLFICNKYNNSPVSINPILNELISLRMTDEIYNGVTTKSRQLGLKLMDCLIPDEALTQIPWQDILLFREKTKAYFEAWDIELKKIEATLFKENSSLTNSDISNLIDSDINPRLFELKREIEKIKEDRYKNILKTVKNVLLSGISLGALSGLSITGAIVSFLGANVKTPQITDEIIDAHFSIKDRQRSNGLTYLLKIQEKFK